ncbi:MAG: type III secretion system gatekeeper subunit SctW [Chlamydiales bacterium]|nr:type III secretion system gatekeeper subunit SctW [Chlamydiales bacterium]
MTDPLRVNLSAIQAKQAQAQSKQAIARQVASEDSFTEAMEDAFNPAASEREQGRFGRFRTLESRRRNPAEATGRIKQVEERTEQDLAHDFEQRNPELPADELNALRNALREEQTAEEILESVIASFEDATLADEALDYLSRSTEGALKQKVLRARILHNELKGREILAGRNIDTAAKAFHKKGVGESPTQLRELYREVTGDPKPHNALFSQLSEQYEFDELQNLVNFLLQGMAYDLKSKGPSISEAELQILMTEVRNLQSILWVYLFFRSRMEMIKKLYERYGLLPKKDLKFQKLAKAFIKIAEDRYPSVLKIIRQTDNLGLEDEEEKVIILSQFRDAVRKLSPRIYKSVRHKQDLLLAIIEALEELEEEDEDE